MPKKFIDGKECTVPSFTEEEAKEKVNNAVNLWNTQIPKDIVEAYTRDTEWTIDGIKYKGREDVQKFLEQKWSKTSPKGELDYRLRKTLFCFQGNLVAVIFRFACRNIHGEYQLGCGMEDWIFREDGLMSHRIANIIKRPITKEQYDARIEDEEIEAIARTIAANNPYQLKPTALGFAPLRIGHTPHRFWKVMTLGCFALIATATYSNQSLKENPSAAKSTCNYPSPLWHHLTLFRQLFKRPSATAPEETLPHPCPHQ